MNYNSVPRRFNKPTSSINHAYIDSTLKNQQNTIDQNYGIMQQSVEAVLGADLIREEDRGYLKEKVSSVLNTLGDTGSINFSSKKARFSIQDALSKAARDPKVLKQVANTKKIRQIQQFQQDRSKKGTLNQQNFQYAYQKSGVNNYLSGNSGEVGSFQYLEYSDVDKKISDEAIRLKAALPDDTIEIQDWKTGETIKKKISQVTPEEMESHLRVQLNSNDLKQLEIDGSMMYGMDNQAAMNSRDSVIKSKKLEYKTQIDKLQKSKDENDSLTEGQKQQKQDQIDQLESNSSQFEQNMLLSKTAETIGGQQLMNNRLKLYASMFTQDRVLSKTYDKEALKALRDSNVGGGSPNYRGEISTLTSKTNLPDGVNILRDARTRADDLRKQETKIISTAISGLPTEKQDIFKSRKDEIRKRADVIKEFGSNISDQTLNKLALDELGSTFLPPNVKMEVEDARKQVMRVNKRENEVTDKYITTGALSEDVIDQVLNDEKGLLMSLPQGDVNMREYLESNGVKDSESYKTFVNGNSKEAKKYKSSLALQTVDLSQSGFFDKVGESEIEESNIPLLGGFVDSFNSYKQAFTTQGNLKIDDREYQIMRKAAEDVTGETLEDTYNVTKEKSGDYTLKLKNKDTGFAKVVNQTQSNFEKGSFGTGISNISIVYETLRSGFGLRDTDLTARNESEISSEFSNKKYDEFYENELGRDFTTVAGSNLIRIQGSLEKSDVTPIWEEVANKVSSQAAFDYRRPIDIYAKPDGGYKIYQISKSFTKVEGEESVANQTIIQADINKTDIPQMTLFNEYIKNEEGRYTAETLSDLNSEMKDIRFIGNSEEQNIGLNKLLNRDIPREDRFRRLASESESKKILFTRQTNELLNMYPEVGNKIKAQFDDFQKNTHNYSMQISKGLDEDYIINIFNKETNTEVGEIPLGNNVSLDLFKKVYYGAPSAFLSIYTQKQILDYKTAITTNGR
ncbi:MAG: hypothetical protein ACJAVA_000167 [Flavobacteriaceae bacterium]|jgi:hypothetical protein